MLRFFVLLAAALCITAQAAEVLGEREFAERYAALVASTYGATATVVDRLEVRITTDDERSSTSYLDNAYLAYLGEPSQLDAVLRQFVASLGETFVVGEAGGLDSLFPVVKAMAYVEQVREMIRQADDYDPEAPFPLYYESLNEDLVVMYAFDSETSIRFASAEDIETLGLRGKALQIRAMDNLLAYLPDIGREGDDSLSLMVADGNYEASLLLYDEIWNRDIFRVAGDIVVFVPARDVLLVTGSEDTEGLSRAKELIDANEFAYAISEHAYVRTVDGWARFER